VHKLGAEVDAARRTGDRRGWFTAMYRQTTNAVRDRVAAGAFDLLLGINAHINLDLAVVAAEICPGDAIHGLRHDFMAVNDVLGSMMPKVKACIGRFSPLLDVVDRVSGGEDDEILNFSIRVARNQSWSQALVLASTTDPARRAELVDSLDRSVAVLGKVVASPGGLLQRAVDLVAATESDDVVAVMDALGRVRAPLL
jgi:hypothetical protein